MKIAENEVEKNNYEIASDKITVNVDTRSVFEKIINVIQSAFGDNDIRVGVKNSKVDADVSINKDNFHINMKKINKKETT